MEVERQSGEGEVNSKAQVSKLLEIVSADRPTQIAEAVVNMAKLEDNSLLFPLNPLAHPYAVYALPLALLHILRSSLSILCLSMHDGPLWKGLMAPTDHDPDDPPPRKYADLHCQHGAATDEGSGAPDLRRPPRPHSRQAGVPRYRGSTAPIRRHRRRRACRWASRRAPATRQLDPVVPRRG